ncbi:ABC transporter ATP-binding protein [Lentisphaera profundi]|uniref:ABC transporter ATP-binding protein n=1 Tax=Lentisphaera profundi TaxID=1658616 RepID=A0ABY7W125_9BACT|nr:ABC transporter ATP-binding protein [Lentisphaera profundi]WDE99173.1 ABC transporter ATP-binding protein [Lentisphaera profundi]
MTKPLLSIKDLSCHFAKFCAVDKISFELMPGECFALLGASGCGKTTALRAIAGLETPSGGSIHHRDQTFFDAKTNLLANLRNTGFIFQDYAIFPHLSIQENITFGIKDKSEKKNILERMLTLLGLEEHAKKMPHQVSGGQLQRVAIARTLAIKPSLVLMDEPFSNLDATLARRLRNEIRGIFKAEGISSILVTHNQEEAFDFADRLAVMEKGQILQIGTPEELYQQPHTSQIASFFGHCQIISGKAQGHTATTSIGEILLQKNISGKCEILLRPENLRIDLSDESSSIIKDIRFLGARKELTIQVPDTQIFANVSSRTQIKIGDKVKITPIEACPAF